jgi:YidC/Oxa1 family membrane protein insertase
MDKRTILAIVLSLAVILVYQIFFFKPPVKAPAPPQEPKKEALAPPTKTIKESTP